jgi:WD40 repeat protein
MEGGHTSLVRALAYDPTIGVLVSGSYDRTVRVWDLRRIMERVRAGEVFIGDDKEREAMTKDALVRVYEGVHTSNVFKVGFDCKRIIRWVPILSSSLLAVCELICSSLL